MCRGCWALVPRGIQRLVLAFVKPGQGCVGVSPSVCWTIAAFAASYCLTPGVSKVDAMLVEDFTRAVCQVMEAFGFGRPEADPDRAKAVDGKVGA